MKKSIYFTCLLFTTATLFSQPLVIKGRVKCFNSTSASTKGAENIVVVPTFLPSKSTVTATRPSGYFEFNTGISLQKLQDKQVAIYIVSRCATCKEGVRRVFISEDQDRQNRIENKAYYTIKDWTLKSACTQAELDAMRADSILNVIIKHPGQDLNKVASSTAVMGTPAFLNLLTNIITAAGVLPNQGQFKIQNIYSGNTSFGQFLFASSLFNSANTGFNFSPSRDMSEAVFWNSSAIAHSRKPHNISLLTNMKSNFKLGGFNKVNDKISIGAGGIYTAQDEFRRLGFYRIGNDPAIFSDTIVNDSINIKLKEFAAFVTPVYKLNEKMSIALTIKSIWQNFNNPDRLDIDNNGKWYNTDTTVKRQRFDADISFTYKINPSWQVGVSAMNLSGAELFADPFVPWKEIAMHNQRSFGMGVTYKYKRWNIGTDVLFTQDDFYDAAIGVNYVPFNNALVSAGFAVRQSSYSLAFRMKHFRLAYINDNDFLFSEARQGKSKFLNGQLHGGFVFDLQ